MFTKGDKVRFKDELVRERRFPPYLFTIKTVWETDTKRFVYDIEDDVTGEKYIGTSEICLVLVEKHEPKPDSEKISKNKKARFCIRKDMFIGLWFMGCPVTLGLYIWLQSYWVFALLLIPLAVGIFGKDD